jgi:hypothetical protein
MQKLNTTIDSPTRKIIENLNLNLMNSEVASQVFSILEPSSTSEKNNSSLTIKMESKLSGVVGVEWRLELRQLGIESIKEHFVLPLMFTCAEYGLREPELFKLIEAKDKELEDYTSQGAKLSRSYFLI